MDFREHSLARIKILAGLAPAELRRIEARCAWSRRAPGETLIERDQAADVVYFLVQGGARAVNTTPDGQEVVFAEFQAGDHFGELAAVDAKGRTSRVVCVEPSLLAALPRPEFVSLLRQSSSVALRLLDVFAAKIRSLTERLTAGGALTARQRIYLDLLCLATPDARGGGVWTISPVPDYDMVARRSGTDRDEVQDTMTALARDRILERHGEALMIKDHARLRTMTST